MNIRIHIVVLVAAAMVMMAVTTSNVLADAIPYPTSGTPNAVTYSFTAASTGEIMAYFAGSTAAYDNQLGMLVNGVLSANGYGLDNQTSLLGQSFDLGHANAGDTLVFVLHSLTLGMDAFSDASMNTAYDFDGSVGHNHVYSTPYTATGPIIAGIPIGIFVSFEDLRFPYSDFNYNDEDFVFTNVTEHSVPEPGSLLLLGSGLIGIVVFRKKLQAITVP